jgi:hypothetical protein
MSYEHDRRLARLFHRRAFSGPTPDAEVLRQAETEHLGHEPTDEEWARLEPKVRERWAHQRKEQISEVYQLLQEFLAESPGPRRDPTPPWDATHQGILDDWLEVPRISILALRELRNVVDELICDTEGRLIDGKPRFVKKKTLLAVPPGNIRKYRTDLPALTARWILDDADRAWKDRSIQKVLQELPGASVRWVLLLSFVPTAVFRTLRLRRTVSASRRTFGDVIRRYSNPATRLSPDDPVARELLQWRAEGYLIRAEATDADLKRMICQACRRPSRERESEIWSAIGLDKTPKSGTSRHEIWDAVALPLLRYLEPFAPRRKGDPSRASPLTPESLFVGASRLLHTRYPEFWEDAPGRLKSRYYSRLD